MAKKILGLLSFLSSISIIVFLLIGLFTVKGESGVYIIGPLILLCLINVIYVIKTRFWKGTSNKEFTSKSFLYLPLKFYGIISSVTGLAGIVFLVWLINDSSTPEYIPIIICFLICCTFSLYPIITKFSTKKDNNEPIRYFKLTKTLSIPVTKLKTLLISFFVLLFIHITCFSEKKYSVFGVTYTKFELSNKRDIYKRNAKECYQFGIPVNFINILYLSYLAIFTSLIVSVNMLPSEQITDANKD